MTSSILAGLWDRGMSGGGMHRRRCRCLLPLRRRRDFTTCGGHLAFRVREAVHQRGAGRGVFAALADLVKDIGSADRGGLTESDVEQ